MKGIYFEQPYESRIDVRGEEFAQGDTVSCTITIKNRSTDAQPLTAVRLQLALGDLKKVKAKSADAYTVVTEFPLPPPTPLEPEAVYQATSEIVLAENCAITDKTQSLFLLYGPVVSGASYGQLQLNVNPHRWIRTVLELFESSFQFVFKGTKNSKGWVVAKFKPSSARRFNRVEELSLSIQKQQDNLALNYNFKKKLLEATATTLEVKKQNHSHEQVLGPSDYQQGGYPNYPGIEAKIEEALQTIASPI